MQSQLGGYRAGQDIALPDTVLMLQGWRIPLLRKCSYVENHSKECGREGESMKGRQRKRISSFLSTKTCLWDRLIKLLFLSFLFFSFCGRLVKFKDYIHTIYLRENKFKTEVFFTSTWYHTRSRIILGWIWGTGAFRAYASRRPELGTSIHIQLDGVYLDQK